MGGDASGDGPQGRSSAADPAPVILDEATSALDTVAEQLIANAGRDPSIANDPAFADVYLWTLPSDRRNEIIGRIARDGRRIQPDIDLRRALETGRADRSVTGDLAFTLVCMGHAKDAVPLARSLVRTEPGNWNFRETLALALIRSGELEEGGRELKAAANLAQREKIPSRDQIRLAVDRAWLFRKQGDEENLKKTLRVLENLKGLDRGLRMEIEEIVAHLAKAKI